MGRTRKMFSAFASLPPELKSTLRASAAPINDIISSVAATAMGASSTSAADGGLSQKRSLEKEDLDPALFLPTQRSAKRARQESDSDEDVAEAALIGGSSSTADHTPQPLVATQLVPFYSRPEDVPHHLQKYFFQRTRLFSRYDEGCLLDEEGWYSVTPERIADQIAERCRCTVVLDACCGVGGNAIAFARTCERVIALDTSPVRLALARHNAAIYGVEDRIEFVLADFTAFAARSEAGTSGAIDVVFLSPPWGGPGYLAGSPRKRTGDDEPADEDNDGGVHPTYSLACMQPLPGEALVTLARRISRHVALYVPRNTDLGEISALVPPGEIVEVEEEWMGSKLKALTCYFGGLAAGQEHLFPT